MSWKASAHVLDLANSTRRDEQERHARGHWDHDLEVWVDDDPTFEEHLAFFEQHDRPAEAPVWSDRAFFLETLFVRHRWSLTSRSERERIQRELVARDGAGCRGCGTVVDLTIDHVVPIRRGGTNDLANLQLLCRVCNSKKGTR